MTSRLKGILRSKRLQSRRSTLFKLLLKKHGFVPCFVCGLSVSKGDATLEHIIPQSKGGTDEMSNLSISHRDCNRRRGNETSDKVRGW